MLGFRRYIASLGILRDLCALVCVYRATQAVFVEPADVWQIGWYLNRAGRSNDEIERVVGELHRAISSGDPEQAGGVLKSSGAEYPFRQDPQYDFEWYPNKLRGILNTQYPLAVRIHICRRTLSTTEFQTQQREIERISRGFFKYFQIFIEERPLAVLAAQPGGYVQGAYPGTLGGYLQDQKGNVFGVTCAHVAPAGLSVTDAQGARLGNVVHASTSTPTLAGQLCNLSTVGASTMDVSLYSFPSSTSRSNCTGPSTHYGSGQVAQMTGSHSKGPHNYFIDGIGLIQTLHHHGQDYCFSGLFRITTRPTQWLPQIIGLAFTPNPVQGDSGAWILSQGTGSQPEWIGMMIGIDQLDGFALDASLVLAWANSATGSTLSVR